jgi:hypothetical protein
MDDNIWEYPFGELDEDEEIFFGEPVCKHLAKVKKQVLDSETCLFRGKCYLPLG